MKVYLHIGLHKTATKYFQHKVFKHLENDKVIYNPELLTQYMMDYIKADNDDKLYVLDCFTKEYKKLEREFGEKKVLLISKEALSGNLFSGYNDWTETVKNMKTLFPEAEIFLFFRYQVDWLISCYRESIHEHHYQSIEEFLNYDYNSKEFVNIEKESKFANFSIYNLDYEKMLNCIKQYYADEKINIFFFENFKENKQKIIDDIFRTMNLDEYVGFKALDEGDTQPNKGYSALAINLSIYRYQILKFLNLNFLVHRPIFFVGYKSIPAGNEMLTCLDTNKYWGAFLLRDNEEVRSANYPNLTFFEKIKREFTWRYFIKNRFDKFIYIDWDIMAEHREKLNIHFKDQNKRFLESLKGKVENVPEKYL